MSRTHQDIDHDFHQVPMTPTSASPTIQESLLRRVSAALYRRPRLVLGALLTPPVLWLVVIYLGSLALLFISSLWHLDPVNGIVRDPSLVNFQEVFSPDKPYLRVAQHTVGIAVIVTIADALLAFPLAYYMARVASPRTRSLLFIAATIPLWISYLVRVYSWRIILADGGFLDWALGGLGLKGPGPLGDVPIAIVFTYIWLPYMILPLYAGLERIPKSLLEASNDLGGRSWTTFRRVVLPLAFPGLVAGSIFTFSLTLGDYITPTLFSGEQFIGNVIYSNVGVAGNVPLAAAYALVPVAVVAVYLVFARRLGAFEAL